MFSDRTPEYNWESACSISKVKTSSSSGFPGEVSRSPFRSPRL
jgi:hypothetical protein